MALIRAPKPIQDLQLKDLFSLDLLGFEKRIGEIMAEASSQMILESMLNKIREFWSEQTFEFYNYQDKA